jgi:lipid II:glycine glycyltransferase (peptidoglycan interpeptide bridge formation enzyme)
MIRFAEKTEIDDWNAHILANPDGGNLFQSQEFAQQKQLGGWIPRYIICDNLSITVLEKSVPLLGRLWYFPKGPGVKTLRELDDVLPEIKDFAAKNGVFSVKIEPELVKNEETLVSLLKLGLVKTRPIQPNFSTITLDLSPNLDTVLANLNQKGRHAINRAKRDGVTTKLVPATEENCQIMYKLLAETAAGQFQIRSYNYYKSFWQRFEAAGYGQLFFAYFENKIVAGAYAIAYGTKGTYKDGASIRERTAYGASHLLQWRVIEWMKQKGVTVHDLCGAPPSDQIKNPDHPHYGIGRFKTSFNKEVTDYIGAYDTVVRPFAYKLWRKIGERVTLRLHQKFHSESYF